jgi:hypothetical protein
MAALAVMAPVRADVRDREHRFDNSAFSRAMNIIRSAIGTNAPLWSGQSHNAQAHSKAPFVPETQAGPRLES